TRQGKRRDILLIGSAGASVSTSAAPRRNRAPPGKLASCVNDGATRRNARDVGRVRQNSQMRTGTLAAEARGADGECVLEGCLFTSLLTHGNWVNRPNSHLGVSPSGGRNVKGR